MNRDHKKPMLKESAHSSSLTQSKLVNLKRKPKITLLGHEAALDLILTGRPRSLASILKRHFEVELVTPIFSHNQIDQYDLQEAPVSWRAIQAENYPRFFSSASKLVKAITGDIIYALKPRPTSFGLAMLNHFRDKRPLLLDVDDWEQTMCYPYSKHLIKNVLVSLPRLSQPNSYLHTAGLEHFVGQADQITCVSTFFQKRYGGVLLPNGCNTNLYDPAPFDRHALRQERGVDQFKLLMFTGTAHPHKGLTQLLGAFDLLDRSDLRLVIVGPETSATQELLRDPRVLYWGFHPPSQIPKLLSMADMVVLPQINSRQAYGQMPLKLFQAMSMALPIISTPQSDIAATLEGCGLVARSSAPYDLAEKIEFLLDNPEEGQQLGWLARRKCLTHYSWEAMELILDEVFSPYL